MAAALFDNDHIPPESLLPAGYTFRSLRRDDFSKGHLDVLGDLAYIGPVTEEQWTDRFDDLRSCPGTYFILVIVKEDRIVGTGTLVVERKFLFQRGIQGHIEDIAIVKHEQGHGLGLGLLNGLSHIAGKVGCYKTVLDCSPKNIGFYEKCGYGKAGQDMQRYIDPRAKDYHI